MPQIICIICGNRGGSCLLKLLPLGRVFDDLEKDYKQMQPMFFGSVLDWNQIIETIFDFESELNSVNR